MKRYHLIAILLLIACLVTAMVPAVSAARTGRSFQAGEILAANRPLEYMPNTYEAWIYFPSNTPATTRGGVIVGNYSATGRYIFSFEIHQNGNPRLYYTDGDGRVTNLVFDSVNVYNGAWTHVAIVRDKDAKEARCYINGNLAQTLSCSVSDFIPAAVPVVGGDHRTGNGQYFKGQISSVALYYTARTRQDITIDKETLGNGVAMAAWDLSQTADSYSDQTRNGYHLKKTPYGRTFRADERLTLSNAFSAMPNTFEATLSFPADTAESTRGGVILGNYGTNGIGIVNFEVYGKGQPRLYYRDTNNVVTDIKFSEVNVYTGTKLHLAITLDPSAKKVHCYIDGVLKQSVDYTPSTVEPASSLVLGGDLRINNETYFKGTLLSVALYSETRTEAQIKADSGTLGNGTPLAAWDLYGNSDYYRDLSGKGYDALRNNIGSSFSSNAPYLTEKSLSAMPNTMEAWVHFPADMDTATRGGVIVGNYPYNSAKNVNLEVYTKGQPRLYYVDGSGTAVSAVFDQVNLYNGKWTHVAVVRDASKKQAHCYINGELKQTVTLDVATFVPDGSMVVGGDNRSWNEQYFKGRIRSVTLYSDMRTAEEIGKDQANFKNGDPIAAWNLMAQADTYTDYSGKGCHLQENAMWIPEKESVTGYDYTFAIIGDTQCITDYDDVKDTRYLDVVYQWLVDNKDARKIKYVMGMGDITEHNTTREWQIAKDAITQLDGNIPYSLVCGNHDRATQMDQFFAGSAYAASLEGTYNGSVVNSWKTITVGTNKIPYLIMTLEYGPSDEVLAWADEVVSSHPFHNVIITTHAYLYRDGTTLDSGDVCPPSNSGATRNNGDQVWEKFVQNHGNIVMVLSGHDPCYPIVYRQDPGKYGNVITQMLIDPQSMDKRILAGPVALFHFSADGSKVQIEYYSTLQQQYFMSNSQFEMTVHTVEPAPDSLYFNFENSTEAQERYDNYAYGYTNFDKAENWWNNDDRTTAPTIANGIISYSPSATTTDTYYYIHSGKSIKSPLHYIPGESDYCQVNIKVENVISTVENGTGRFTLYYGANGGDMGGKNYDDIDFTLDGRVNSHYFVLTFPMDSEAYTGADYISAIRPQFSNLRSSDGQTAKFNIDYLYIGPKEGLPTPLYTVTFKNSDGTILGTQEVLKGSTASYTGATPAKAYDATNHYTFKGWDKALTNISAHTTVTATYTATAHSYTYAKVDDMSHKATCSCGSGKTEAHGYIDGLCLCGHTEVKEPVLETGWKLGHSLNLASDISINYAIAKTTLTGYDMDTIYILAQIDTYEGNEKTGTKEVKLLPVEQGNYYYFVLEGMTAVNMNDEIRAVLYGTKDGQVHYSNVDTYSVATYAYAQLAKTSIPQKLKLLCAELLRYGSKAQIYKAYRTDSLVDAKMTEEQKALLSDMDAVTFGNTNLTENIPEINAVTLLGKSLDLASKVSIKFIFSLGSYTGNTEDLTMKVTYTDIYGAEKELIIPSVEVYNASRGYYAFTIDSLLAAELRSVLTVQILSGETVVSGTAHYAADTYGNGKTGTLGDLCKALFAYSDSAKAYFTN